jgi:outer membrane protein assembly factor BamB
VIARGLVAALLAGLVAACGAPQSAPAPLVSYAGRPVRLNTHWTVAIEQLAAFEKSAEQFGGVAYDPASQTVVAALASGRIIGLDAGSGATRWTIEGEAAAGGAPVIAEGIVYVGVHDGTFRALRATTGELVWKASVAGSFNSTPLVTGDLVVSVLSGNGVIALKRATGEVAWRRDRAASNAIALQSDATVTAAGDDLFAGYADGNLERLDRTGKSIWCVPLARNADRFKDVDTTPLVLGDTVYAASFGGGLFAISRAQGSVVWQQALKGISQMARTDDSLVVITGDAQLHWLAPETGETTTAFALEEVVADGLVVSNGYLMVSTSERGLYLLDSKTPWVHGRLDAGAGFSTPVAVSGSMLFALTDGGSVLRVDLSLL